MEWHFGLLVITVLGLLYPPMLLLTALGLGYTAFYSIVCAVNANVSNVIATDGPPTFWRRVRWRSLIALLNFLEPLARDWGRLKGGLTPWRTAILPKDLTGTPVWTWRRLQPVRRALAWSHAGGRRLEKFVFLERLTARLAAGYSAVGWNPSTENWDLRIRRGILGEAFVRMVVEHHGGMKRFGRMSGSVRLPTWTARLLMVVAVVTIWMTAIGQVAAAAFAGGALLTVLVATILEACRLEAAITLAADTVARELDAEIA
jgi:hypothetical protein